MYCHISILTLTQLSHFRRDGGFTGLLNEITNSHQEGMWGPVFCFTLNHYVFTDVCIYNTSYVCVLIVPKWLSVTCGCILALLQRVSSFHGSLFPHVTVSLACWLNIVLLCTIISIITRWMLSWFIKLHYIYDFCSIVEQRGHDSWVFTGAELVSIN